MSLNDRTAEKLTPEDRRTMLRAFADRMLLKVSAMDDPEDMPGVEKAVRVAASIERIYYRCDRAEHHASDPHKLEAERATHKSEAIKARVALASTLEWGEQRQKQLGKWWDVAQTTAEPVAPVVTPAPASQPAPQTETPAGKILGKFPQTPAEASDYLARILKTYAALEQGDLSENELAALDEEVDDWLQDRLPPD